MSLNWYHSLFTEYAPSCVIYTGHLIVIVAAFITIFMATVEELTRLTASTATISFSPRLGLISLMCNISAE